MEIFYIVAASLLILPAFLFVVLPVLPSVPYMLIIAIVFDLITGRINQSEMIILVSIAIISILVDYFSGLFGARWGGASGKSLLIGTIGMLVGSMILPIFGGLIGLFVGVLVSETILFPQSQKALKAASASLVGSIVGMVTNIVLCLMFFVLFLVYAIKV